MPAKNLTRITAGKTYYHVFNRGIENRSIFAQDSDYQVFLGYLKDYLDVPKDRQSTKTEFTVNGRVFQGVPHQPKNYFGKVELLAYNLKPDHFHLLLHPKTSESLQAFIRSLCTRYSMYFNKKYNRTGSLFEGPYKSAVIGDDASLLLLTRYLHKAGSYSSYPDYLAQKEIPWLKTKDVLSAKGGKDNYKDFVEKYVPSQKETALLGSIIIEDDNKHLERRDLKEATLKPWMRFPELAAACLIFAVLIGLGLRNISAAVKNTQIASSDTLGTKTFSSPSPSPTPPPQPKIMLTVTNVDEPVNIREQPTVESKTITQARGGDVFEIVSENTDWYQIKLPNGTFGFIFSQFVEKEETGNTTND